MIKILSYWCQNTSSGGGFQLNKERNIPLEELRACYSVLGNRFQNLIHVVFSNWSRQFARVNDRLARGMTEEAARRKVETELLRCLGIRRLHCYFMDSVFWRNEERGMGRPAGQGGQLTTLQAAYSLAGTILGEPYDPVSNSSTPRAGRRPGGATSQPHLRLSGDFSSDSEADTSPAGRLHRWKSKLSNLAGSRTELSGSDHCSAQPVQPTQPAQPAGRQVPIQREEPAGGSEQEPRRVPVRVLNHNGSKMDLSDYVEQKVQELMEEEGVTIDFKGAKVKGKIITKTKIIREVIGKNGEVEFVEEEKMDESLFGPEMEKIVNISSPTAVAEPVYNLGAPVISDTFERQPRSTVSTSNGWNPPDEGSSAPGRAGRAGDTPAEESDTYQVIQAGREDGGRVEAVRTRVRSDDTSDSDSGSIDIDEAIDEALEQGVGVEASIVVESDHVVDVDAISRSSSPDRATTDRTVVLLGTEERIAALETGLAGRAATLSCAVAATGGPSQFGPLVQQLQPATEVVFVWTVASQSGEIDSSLVAEFQDFLSVFPAESVASLVVVLWYPGAMEDIRESIEDLTEIVRTNYQYKSSLGFPVLQYKPDTEFIDSLVNQVADVKSFLVSEIILSQAQTSEMIHVDTEDVVVMAGEEMVEPQKDERVDDPVVLVVGAPGHGKSSVANLILGGEQFPVRGGRTAGERLTGSGRLQRDCRVSLVEAPGIWTGERDLAAVSRAEQEVRSAGHLTHLILVWHALELRLSDLDCVLEELLRMFGPSILPCLVLAVTFCDSSSKAKRYRSKRGITFDSLVAMLNQKLEEKFGSSEEAVIYFLSAKSPRDTSRKHLVKYLSSGAWEPYSLANMRSWTETRAPQPGTGDRALEDKTDQDYEDVEEEVFQEEREDPDNEIDFTEQTEQKSPEPLLDKSKSLHNLSLPMGGVGQERPVVGPLGGSLVSVRGRGRGRSTGNLFRPNKQAAASSSQLSGRGRSTANLLGQRSRSRSLHKLSKSQANLSATQPDLSLGSRRDLSADSRSNVYEEAGARSEAAGGRRARARARGLSTGSMGRQQEGSGTLGRRMRETSRDEGRREASGERGRGEGRRGPTGRPPRSLSKTRQRQSASLPRAGVARPPIQRSRSSWSLRSANYKRQQKPGDCTIL